MKWSDRVGGIPYQQHLRIQAPACAPDSAHDASRIGCEFIHEMRHELGCICEVLIEECLDTAGDKYRFEALGSVQGQEQRNREAAVNIRQRDEHESATWPDVQGVLLEPMAPVVIGWESQFLVAMWQNIFAAGNA